MGDTCEICKKNPAKISIGNHSYCFDCHNKMALHDMGIDDNFTYAKNMSVIEPNGKIHTFEIEHGKESLFIPVITENNTHQGGKMMIK